MAQLAIKNLSRPVPFTGGPWNLPQNFPLYLIIIIIEIQSGCQVYYPLHHADQPTKNNGSIYFYNEIEIVFQTWIII